MTVGMIGALSLAESMALPWIDRAPFSRFGILDRGAIRRFASEQIERFDIRTSGPEARTAALSGGNLQKALLARELARQPRILLAAQPTRGIDVGATEFIHGEFLALRARGGAVLLISEDLEELFALSDRIAVMYGGRIMADIPVEDGDGRTRRPAHGRHRGASGMIVRTWRGRAPLSKPDDYVRHFRTNVVADLRSVDGFLGATLVRQVRPDDIEFLVITRWRSMDAIRGFAGDAVGRAVVEPGRHRRPRRLRRVRRALRGGRGGRAGMTRLRLERREETPVLVQVLLPVAAVLARARPVQRRSSGSPAPTCSMPMRCSSFRPSRPATTSRTRWSRRRRSSSPGLPSPSPSAPSSGTSAPKAS